MAKRTKASSLTSSSTFSEISIEVPDYTLPQNQKMSVGIYSLLNSSLYGKPDPFSGIESGIIISAFGCLNNKEFFDGMMNLIKPSSRNKFDLWNAFYETLTNPDRTKSQRKPVSIGDFMILFEHFNKLPCIRRLPLMLLCIAVNYQDKYLWDLFFKGSDFFPDIVEGIDTFKKNGTSKKVKIKPLKDCKDGGNMSAKNILNSKLGVLGALNSDLQLGTVLSGLNRTSCSADTPQLAQLAQMGETYLRQEYESVLTGGAVPEFPAEATKTNWIPQRKGPKSGEQLEDVTDDNTNIEMLASDSGLSQDQVMEQCKRFVCGICWICNRPVYIYYNTTTNQSYNANCGQQEHVVPPGPGHMMGLLMNSLKDSKIDGNISTKRLLYGLRTSHAACNEEKEDVLLITFPWQNSSETYGINNDNVKRVAANIRKFLTGETKKGDPRSSKSHEYDIGYSPKYFQGLDITDQNNFFLDIEKSLTRNLALVVMELNNVKDPKGGLPLDNKLIKDTSCIRAAHNLLFYISRAPTLQTRLQIKGQIKGQAGGTNNHRNPSSPFYFNNTSHGHFNKFSMHGGMDNSLYNDEQERIERKFIHEVFMSLFCQEDEDNISGHLNTILDEFNHDGLYQELLDGLVSLVETKDPKLIEYVFRTTEAIFSYDEDDEQKIQREVPKNSVIVLRAPIQVEWVVEEEEGGEEVYKTYAYLRFFMFDKSATSLIKQTDGQPLKLIATFDREEHVRLTPPFYDLPIEELRAGYTDSIKPKIEYVDEERVRAELILNLIHGGQIPDYLYEYFKNSIEQNFIKWVKTWREAADAKMDVEEEALDEVVETGDEVVDISDAIAWVIETSSSFRDDYYGEYLSYRKTLKIRSHDNFLDYLNLQVNTAVNFFRRGACDSDFKSSIYSVQNPFTAQYIYSGKKVHKVYIPKGALIVVLHPLFKLGGKQQIRFVSNEVYEVYYVDEKEVPVKYTGVLTAEINFSDSDRTNNIKNFNVQELDAALTLANMCEIRSPTASVSPIASRKRGSNEGGSRKKKRNNKKKKKNTRKKKNTKKKKPQKKKIKKSKKLNRRKKLK